MRLLRRALIALAALVVAFAALVGFLASTTPGPRATEAWKRLADLPAPRGEAASATTADGTLVVAGGLAGPFGSTVARVDAYDPAADGWKRLADLPEARHHAGAAALGRDVYVTGGAKTATDWKPEREAWVLRAGATEWAEIPAMPEGRMGHQLVAVGARLYAIGGRGGHNVLVYSDALGWREGAEMPAPRDHLAAVVVGGKIYAIGGRDARLLARVDVYDPIADTWSQGPALPIPMSAMAAGALADGIHVVGGEDPATLGGGVLDRHYRLDGDRWVAEALPIVATHGSASGVAGGRLIVAGGSRRQGSLSVLGWTGITEAFAPPRT